MDRVKCQLCKKTNTVKNGKVRGVQRYWCKTCEVNFSEHVKRKVLTNAMKQGLLLDYLIHNEILPNHPKKKYSKLSIRQLANMNSINHVTATKWVREYEAS